MYFIVIFVLALAGTFFILSFILPVGIIGSRAHGSATFAKKSVPRVGNKGLKIDGIRSLTLKQSHMHCMIIGPTGKGKSQKFTLHNIMFSRKKTSYVITDPKNEIFELMAPALVKAGFKVLQLNFAEPEKSLRYNPLLRLDDDAGEYELATQLYDMENQKANGKSEGSIWRSGAIELAFILIRCIRNIPEKKYRTMPTLLHLLRFVEDGSQKISNFVIQHAPDQDTIDRFYAYQNDEVKIRKGIHGSIKAALSVYGSQSMKYLLSADDIDFQDLRDPDKKIALFINSPAGEDKYNKLLTLFYSQLFRFLLNTPMKMGENNIFIILEEFGNLSKLPSLAQTLALIRSKRVSITIILQNLLQLHSIYGKNDSETILANCASLILYPGIKDETTLRFASGLLGETTIQMQNLENSGIQLFKRNLLTKDEVMRLNDDEGIFFFSNKLAQKITTRPFYQDKAALRRNHIVSVGNKLVALLKFIPPDSEISLEVPRFPIERFEEVDMTQLLSEEEKRETLKEQDRIDRIRNILG